MINQEKITTEWLNQVSKNNKGADKILVEKVIMALLLLEGLVKQEISFVFKGGTALMLHFNSTKRLSIDIDIILPQEIENLEAILDKVVAQQGFLRQELQHRNTQSKIKKEHYKFFYTPLHKTSKDEEYVLLDILFEEVSYSKIISIPIQSAFIPNTDVPIQDPAEIKDWEIGKPLNNKLNKLKKSNPEAFFYWYKIYELIKAK